MRVIAIEEHFVTAEVLKAQNLSQPEAISAKLLDIGDARLAAMDAAGVDLQVLSSSQPGVQTLNAGRAVALARSMNDQLAEIIAERPERFSGFATLPTPDPTASVAEFERSVHELGLKGAMIHGHTQGQFLDNEAYWPILECAEALEVPIYLHPTRPPEEVWRAYFADLNPDVARVLSTNAWGWHVETGMHALRVVAAGVFDRFPRLQFILGHMGENIPFSLARADAALAPVTGHLQRRVADYFRENFFITTSGYITAPPLLCALMVFGADRIIFSVDYPFGDNAATVQFLDQAPISPADREKIAHLNVEGLLGL